ncbi:hypothetical protein TevJSym_aw00200 [endosymbiont of Tevnia jerichonana (vent Tica)]|uniref:Uncharacterized protein n=1 Tax=endosymbiont of Tevnia jerichonana (vent Tica) TaxID=1049564 RepID=G2FHM7_9GAMM|nr:hypothetical protein TevJSym_aw00200 [endosymbiont of Tevnia jerichonana (vent Tica)]
MPAPGAIVLLEDGVQVGLHLGNATLNRHTRFRHAYLLIIRVFDSLCGASGANTRAPHETAFIWQSTDC